MRTLCLALGTLVVLTFSGCTAPSAPAAVEAPMVDDHGMPDVQTFEWSGHVMTSEGESISHMRPTEDLVWDIQQEGILADIPEGVSELEVALSWDGPGDFMIMLHSHKGEATSGSYVEHITEMDATNPKCLRVPAADVNPGHWQVMIHSSGAQMTDFTLHILTVGGLATDSGEFHGHDRAQEGVPQIEEHEIEPCQYWQGEASHQH